jgi:hypothetical protein
VFVERGVTQKAYVLGVKSVVAVENAPHGGEGISPDGRPTKLILLDSLPHLVNPAAVGQNAGVMPFLIKWVAAPPNRFVCLRLQER